MREELELSEQLVNEGFTPFGEIEELTTEKILDKEIYEYIFSIDNDISREDLIIKLQIQAKKLKIAPQFNRKLRLYREMYVKNLKGMCNNKTDFKDCPYEQLKCGEWTANETGVYKMEFNGQMQQIKIKASPIPILIVERLVNVDTNTEKVKIAFFKDAKWQEIIVEKNTISSKTKILQLANRGIEVTEDNAKNLITYLADLIELNNIMIKQGVSHLGWVKEEFVPYTEQYCLDIDQEFKEKISSIKSGGNYDEWKNFITKLRRNSVTLKFMIAGSFASVLAKIFKINTFIIHLWGKSGNGKTVAEMICASIWGRPDNNLISNLSNTSIANERLCNFYRNMPIFLDELQIAKSKYKTFDEMIYALTEGKGKERGNIDNGIREQTIWQTIIILSGEEPITTDASKEGVKNRVIEINEDNPIVENGNEVVKFIQENYGFAGKEFVEIIQEKKQELEKYQQELVNKLGEILRYKKQINAYSIILTADYIISKYIFKDEPLQLKDVSKYFSKDTDETERYYNLILDWFYQNINRFSNGSNDINIGEMYGRYDTTAGDVDTIYVLPKVLKDFLKEQNINFEGVKKKLADNGYIMRNSKTSEYTHPIQINGGRPRCIKIIVKPELSDLQFEQQEMEDLPF